VLSGTYLDRGKSGAIGSHQDPTEVEANVQSRAGRLVGLGDSGSGGKGKHATKNLLEWGSAIRVGDVGFSVLGTGLGRCDSE